MAGSTNHRYFIELNDFSVAFLRTASPGDTLVVEDYRDANPDNADAVKDMIRLARSGSTAGDAPIAAICSIRCEPGNLHLATSEEAGRHRTPSAIASFLAQHASFEAEATECLAIHANTGRAVDGSSTHPWLGLLADRTRKDALLAKLDGWGMKPELVESATFSLCGAVQDILAGDNSSDAVVIWEVGKTTSDLLLVGARGVEATRRVSFGFERIVDAILAEIPLKFRGAASKLFFNDRYDFSIVGPKAAKRIADALAVDMSQLVSDRSPKPTKFILGGFPSQQDWFAGNLAECIGLEIFDPPAEPWLAKSGIRFAEKGALSGVSPGALGVFGLVVAHGGQGSEKSPAWHPALTTTASQIAENAPTMQASAATPAKNPPETQVPATATPTRTTNSKLEMQRSPSGSPTNTTPQKGSASRVRPTSLPRGVRIANPDTMGLSDDSRAADNRKKSQMIRNLGLAAGVLALLGAGYLYFQKVEQQKQVALEARQLAEQQAAANERARFEAEQRARAEAAARQRAEEEMAARTAAAEAARIRAEEAAQAIRAERERLLHTRGSVRITSIPSGAKVTIPNRDSKLSPADFSDLRLGQYNATLELDGFDSATIKFAIDGEELTEPSAVRLIRHTGKLEITTKPVGVPFEIRPASPGPFTSAMQSRIGITPHTFGTLPTDDYIVTLKPEGLPDVSRAVTIEHDATTTLFENLVGGVVRITSNPSGASVFGEDDTLLGVTPLELDVAAGEASFRVEHPEYDPTILTAHVELGGVTALAATLEPIAKLARISELDRKPTPTRRIEPDLDDPKNYAGFNAIISLIVNEEGRPESVEIDEATDPEFGQLCAAAVRQWEFKPGRIGRTAVRTKVKIPFKIR